MPRCVVPTAQHVLSRRFFFFFSLASAALDNMGTRIDDLEKNVLELMSQAGMEEQASPK